MATHTGKPVRHHSRLGETIQAKAMMPLLVASSFLLASAGGCGGQLEALPEGATPVGAVFENGVRLEGVALSEGTLEPGARIPVTLYFRASGPVSGDALVQLFLTGDCPGFILGGADQPLQDATGTPATGWKEGALVPIRLELSAPERLRSEEGTFWVALARGGNQRYAVQGVPTDLNSRAEVARRPFSWRAPMPVPSLSVPVLALEGSSPKGGTTEGPITLDGRLEEPAWQTAAVTAPLVGPAGAPVEERTVARMLIAGGALYVGLDVVDPDLFSQFREPDDPVSLHDAVVVMLRPDLSRPAMVEIAVSPRNVVRDSLHPMCREREEVGWSGGIRSAVAVRGTLEEPSDTDGGYGVELAIPIAALERAVVGGEAGSDASAGGGRLLRPGEPWSMQILQYDFRAPYREAPMLRSWSPLFTADPWSPSRFGRLEAMRPGG